MAVQSLYRRYRPRRFDELRGQDHVVRALRNAVVNHREGQAYLFSGPRGTGKTSTARILAKVLNCEEPENGEPCGICNSCAAIDSGNSYDVLELDAASNNGVESIRDLIERSSLGNPGRHRVFILDEVHMLSKPAEAALLKTLEEPPPHVVFVLATTDPQKVSETIRSRTQHLQFHLLPISDLESHVRYVIKDANLKVSEDAIQHVLHQGGGSARDTLSALELVAAAGGEVDAQQSATDFVEALINKDASLALSSTARAIQHGADPRSLGEDIVRALRECFLSAVAPELVQLPDGQRELVADQARRLGTPRTVRAIEVLGEILIEMRHAPDARLLLEVALVKLTSSTEATDLGPIIARLERLESVGPRDSSIPAPRPAPVNPATGKVQVGGKAKTASLPRDPSAPVERPTAAAEPVKSAAQPATDAQVLHLWPTVLAGLRPPLLRALFSAVSAQDFDGTTLHLRAPNAAHLEKVNEKVDSVQEQLSAAAGRPITIELTVSEVVERTPSRGTTRPRKVESDLDDMVDVTEVVDAPKDAMPSMVDKLAEAFPGSQIIDKKRK